MPQIIFKGVKKDDVISISKSLPTLLSDVSATPVDYFTLELPNTQYFSNGKECEMYPLIEVIQFDRGLDIESKMAHIIQSCVKKCGYSECEVYFTHIEKQNYYE